MDDQQPYNSGRNATVLALAHQRLDELAARAADDHTWGWVRVGIRYRDGLAKQVERHSEGTDGVDENSNNVD